MRRKEREITDTHQLQQILEECKVCRVAMQDKDGLYLVPLNFGYQYQDGKLTLYLHSSKEGRRSLPFPKTVLSVSKWTVLTNWWKVTSLALTAMNTRAS